MAITTRAVGYDHEGAKFEGMLAYDDSRKGARPAVIVSHAWAGRSDIEIGYAKKLAALGYAGFALDLYGGAKVAADREECQKLMMPLATNRPKLQARLLRIVDVVKGLPEVDAAKVAVIGFCFGGLCALDAARAGADIKGAASFHGILTPPGNTAGKTIKGKIAVYHGWDDPMVKPETVLALAKELTEAKADWTITAFGGAMHAFMTPGANDPDFGTVYNEKIARRAWASLEDFLKECFG
ncbi:MAG TPA: dienelactone hydrolase family protein [Parvularculaceae bacterium]|nr:dienelactone hydrolase family protein [Parvularculaceae bacterium]